MLLSPSLLLLPTRSAEATWSRWAAKLNHGRSAGLSSTGSSVPFPIMWVSSHIASLKPDSWALAPRTAGLLGQASKLGGRKAWLGLILPPMLQKMYRMYLVHLIYLFIHQFTWQLVSI